MPPCHSSDSMVSILKRDHFTSSSSEFLRDKCVRFDQLEIIEFPQVLGDNPACRRGVPLTLDWTPVEQSILSIDYYEETRGPRRSQKELREDKHDRLDYLYTNGYKDEHIELALGDVKRIRRRRRESQQDKESSFFKSPLKAIMNSAMKTVAKQPTKLLGLPSKSSPAGARSA